MLIISLNKTSFHLKADHLYVYSVMFIRPWYMNLI